MVKSTAVSALINAQLTGFNSLSQPNGEEDCEFKPQRRAKLAHVTVLQLSQGQLQRLSHSLTMSGLVTGSHTAPFVAALSVL